MNNYDESFVILVSLFWDNEIAVAISITMNKTVESQRTACLCISWFRLFQKLIDIGETKHIWNMNCLYFAAIQWAIVVL